MAKYLAVKMLSVVFLGAMSLAQTTPQSGEPSSNAPPQATMPAPSAAQSQQNQAQQQATPAPATGAAAPAHAGPPRIAPGNVIPVQLTKTVDAKKAKPGDEVIAKVTMDLKNNSGDVIVAKDTEVVGHVTEAQARSKEQKESQLGIAFNEAKTKIGDMQMPMSIQAVIAPPSPNSTDNGGGAPAQTADAGASSPASPSMGGHMGSTPTQQPQQESATTGPAAGAPQPTNSGRPTITGKTEGVIGIPNLKLEAAAQNSAQEQGSVLTSDKNNVKLESGTMILLRVSGSNPQAVQGTNPSQPNQ